MPMATDNFHLLLSDDVFVEAMPASNVRSLRRRLARSRAVRKVSRDLSCDRERMQGLCEFVEDLLQEDYDKRYRHPHDVAVCAALVVLEQSPLSRVRNMFWRLRGVKDLSLAWVQRMAEYCDTCVPCDRANVTVGAAYAVEGPTIVRESGRISLAPNGATISTATTRSVRVA